MDDIILVKKQILTHLFHTVRRAQQYHYHAERLKIAEGVKGEGQGTPLHEDLKLATEVLDAVLNPIPKEFEVIEG